MIMKAKVERKQEKMERDLCVITLMMNKKYLKKEGNKWIKEKRDNLNDNKTEQFKKESSKKK